MQCHSDQCFRHVLDSKGKAPFIDTEPGPEYTEALVGWTWDTHTLPFAVDKCWLLKDVPQYKLRETFNQVTLRSAKNQALGKDLGTVRWIILISVSVSLRYGRRKFEFQNQTKSDLIMQPWVCKWMNSSRSWRVFRDLQRSRSEEGSAIDRAQKHGKHPEWEGAAQKLAFRKWEQWCYGLFHIYCHLRQIQENHVVCFGVP